MCTCLKFYWNSTTVEIFSREILKHNLIISKRFSKYMYMFVIFKTFSRILTIKEQRNLYGSCDFLWNCWCHICQWHGLVVACKVQLENICWGLWCSCCRHGANMFLFNERITTVLICQWKGISCYQSFKGNGWSQQSTVVIWYKTLILTCSTKII